MRGVIARLEEVSGEEKGVLRVLEELMDVFRKLLKQLQWSSRELVKV